MCPQLCIVAVVRNHRLHERTGRTQGPSSRPSPRRNAEYESFDHGFHGFHRCVWDAATSYPCDPCNPWSSQIKPSQTWSALAASGSDFRPRPRRGGFRLGGVAGAAWVGRAGGFRFCEAPSGAGASSPVKPSQRIRLVRRIDRSDAATRDSASIRVDPSKSR